MEMEYPKLCQMIGKTVEIYCKAQIYYILQVETEHLEIMKEINKEMKDFNAEMMKASGMKQVQIIFNRVLDNWE